MTKLSELAASTGCWSGSVTDKNSTVAIAVAIAMAESRGRLDAQHKNSNGTTDYGPWQVNSVHGFDAKKLTSDASYTANAACAVYKKQGWGAWTTYNNGAYKLYLGKDYDLTKDGGVLSDALHFATGALGGAVGLGVDAAIPGASAVTSGNPLNAITGPINTVSHVAGALLNPSTYLRLGKGVLGGVFIIAGAGAITYVVANKSGTAKAAAKIAAL